MRRWSCSVSGASPAGAQSQATTAEINGQVTDAQGGVLPGATVTITNPATGYTRTVVTSAEGLFVVPLLPPGEYEVKFELTGFNTGKSLAAGHRRRDDHAQAGDAGRRR